MKKPLLCLLLALSGCASFPTPVLSPLHWQAQGRFVILYPGASHHAHFLWRQKETGYHIRFSTPLGIGGAQLIGGAQGVTFQDPKGKRLFAPTPEHLLAKTMGWHFPVRSLQYWIQGQPDPTLPLVFYQKKGGRFVLLQQGGWTIRYLPYRALPRQLHLQNDKLTLKIVITQWQ